MNMTPRERILAAMRRQEVDYTPCSPIFNPLSPKQREGKRWQFPWPVEADLRQRVRYAVEELGVDPIVAASFLPQFPVEGVTARTWVEGDVLHKVWSTPEGELRSSVRYDQLWPHGQDIPLFSDFNVGHAIKPWLENERDLACLKHVLHVPSTPRYLDDLRARVRETQAIAEEFQLPTQAYVGMGLTGAQHLFGVSQLCVMTIDQPELVDAYLEYEHGLNLKMSEMAGDFGFDIVHRNGFYETADFYSPQMLEQFLGARLRREAQAVHHAGMLICYTANTGVMPILDYFDSLPFDCMAHLDIAHKGASSRVMRDKLAHSKSFWTGPSSTYHIYAGPEATRAAVREVFEVFGRRGLILGPCPSSHSIMPWESTLAMLDEWRQLRDAGATCGA